jgi:hypothetical protein
MIPCIDCLVLAACKSKETIICDILINYMRKNTVYERTNGGKLLEGIEVWNQVDHLFQREDDEVWIRPSDQSRDDYTIVSKDRERTRSEAE